MADFAGVQGTGKGELTDASLALAYNEDVAKAGGYWSPVGWIPTTREVYNADGTLKSATAGTDSKFVIGPSAPAAPAPASAQTAPAKPATPQQVQQPQFAAAPAPESAESIISRITAENSPLNQRARAIATEEAARRGLQSSSIAAGNASKAVIDAALPIAQTDAQLKAAAANQQNQIAGQMAIAGMQIDANKELAKLNSELDTQSRTELLKLQDKFDSASNGRAALTQSTTRYTDMVNQIKLNPDLDAATKAALIDDLRYDWIQEGERMAAIYGVVLPDDYLPKGN